MSYVADHRHTPYGEKEDKSEWYEVTLTQIFLVKTSDIAGTINLHEFSTFPDLDPDTDVTFQDGKSEWRKVNRCNCGEGCGCDAQVKTEGQRCDECFRVHLTGVEE